MQVKNTLIKLVVIAAVMIPYASAAQTSSINAFSPYTMYGIGEQNTPGTLPMRSMGGVGVAMRSSGVVNLLNPAAFSAAPQKSFLFNFGLEGQNYYNSQKVDGISKSTAYNTFNFHDIAFQLPLAKKLGLGFSLTPYSSVGYRTKYTHDYDPSDPVWGNVGRAQYVYQGEGDVTEVKLGVGWELFKNFMPFLTMLFVANIAIVVLRDIKEDFLVNIIDMSGYSPWLFTQIDSVVTLTILAIFGLMVLVKDNFKALSVLYGLIITGMMVMAFVSFGQERMGLSPVTWLFLQSLCLYMAYLTFQTIFFDRFIACFKIRGNVGFFIVLTDFLGYTGTILVLVLKEFVGTRLDWAVFYNQLAGYVGIFCCATFVASFVYLRQRYRKETALCGCEEIATLEPTENNVLTIA